MGGFERERGRGLLLGRLLFPRPYTSSTRRTDRQGEEEEKVALNGEEERETPPAGDLGGRPEGPPAPLSLSLSPSLSSHNCAECGGGGGDRGTCVTSDVGQGFANVWLEEMRHAFVMCTISLFHFEFFSLGRVSFHFPLLRVD